MGSRPSTSGRGSTPGRDTASTRVKANGNGAVTHASGDPTPALKLASVSKSFGRNPVLKGITFSVAPGEIIEVTGPSGSGKTTLLRLLHGQLRPTAGEVWVGERKLHQRWRRGLGSMRREVAFVFQDQRLLPRLTALENVILAMQVREPQTPYRTLKEKALKVLERVRLSSKVNQYPDQLSGGEKQRVAIARALVTRPKVLLADEPLTAMDEENAELVIHLLEEAAASGIAVVVAGHRHMFHANRILRLPSAKLVANGARRPGQNGNGHATSLANGSAAHTNGNGANGNGHAPAAQPIWRFFVPKRRHGARVAAPEVKPALWARMRALTANAFRLVVLNGLRSWRRDLRLTAPVMGTVAFLLTLAGTLAMIGVSIGTVVLQQASQASVVRVYLAADATPDQVLALVSRLDADPRVATVKAITPAEALAEASSRPGLDNLASLSSTNPFPASLDVTVNRVTQLGQVADIVKDDPAVDSSYPTSYDPDTYSRLRRFALTAGAIGGGILLLFLLVGYVVIANSMRAIASARRGEVSVTSLLGARGWMLRGPFVMEGLTIGALGGAFAAVVVGAVWLGADRLAAATFAQVLPGVGPNAVRYVLASVLVAGLLLGSITALLGFRRSRV